MTVTLGMQPRPQITSNGNMQLLAASVLFVPPPRSIGQRAHLACARQPRCHLPAKWPIVQEKVRRRAPAAALIYDIASVFCLLAGSTLFL